MKKSKKILITTDSRETFIVKVTAKSDVCGFCPLCDAETKLLTLDDAVGCFALGTREMIGKIDKNEIHSIETPSGHLLICLNSLNRGKNKIIEIYPEKKI